jgi:dTDP-4-dehydrorhamnose reductase
VIGASIVAIDRTQLDITDDVAVRKYLRRKSWRLLINTAAYTAVDRAEDEADSAFAVNEQGARNLARACGEAGIPMIHVSTDYVFDGTLRRPYREDDVAAPLGVYGQSKWQGEQAVRQTLPQHVILRVSAVFSSHHHNFVTAILQRARQRRPLRVVADQRTCPTAAADIAETIARIASQTVQTNPFAWGTYHYCGRPETTWSAFADVILAMARQQDPTVALEVTPITTGEYPTRARRPANSVLDCAKIERALKISQPYWRQELARVVPALLRQQLAG